MMAADSNDNRIAAPIAFVASLALLLGLSYAVEARLWGVNWYGYFGWPVRVAAVALALSAGWLWWRVGANNLAADTEARRYFWWSLVLMAALAAAFYLLRARTYFMGDGYQLISKLQEGEHTIKPLDIGSFTVQRWVFGLLGGQGRAAAELTFQIISYACGLFVIVLAFVSGRLLFATPRERFLWLAGVASGGYLLLCFGYAENYPLFVVVVLSFAVVGLLVARGMISRFWIIPSALLALVFHVFGLLLVLAALYIWLRGSIVSRRLTAVPLRWRWILGVVALAAGGICYAYLCQTSYLFRFSVLPLKADRFTLENYTLFAGKHLLDYLNMVVQLLPGLLVALIAIRFLRGTAPLPDGGSRFLIILGVSSMGVVFLLNPGLGMPRDWDLFAFAGVPLVLGVHYRLLRGGAPATSGLVVLLGLFLLAPRAGALASVDKGIAVFDNYAELDKLKNTSGRAVLYAYLMDLGRTEEAYRRRELTEAELPARRVYAQGLDLREKGRFREAIAHFRQTLELDPAYKAAWTALGNMYLAYGMADSARAYLEISDGLNPFNFNTNYHLGKADFALGRYDAAESRWLMAARLAPAKIDPLADLVRLYEFRDQGDKYADCLIRVVDRNQTSPVYLAMIADLYVLRGQYDIARRLYRGALKRGLDPERVRLVEAHAVGFSLDD